MCQVSQKPHQLGIERLTKTRGLLIDFFLMFFPFFKFFFCIFNFFFVFCLFASVFEMAVTGLRQILS